MKNSKLNFHHGTVGRITTCHILDSKPLPLQAQYTMCTMSLNPYINYLCIKSVNGKWELLNFTDPLIIMPLANVSQFQTTCPLGQIFYVNYSSQLIPLPPFFKSLEDERSDYRFCNNHTPGVCHLIFKPLPINRQLKRPSFPISSHLKSFCPQI